MTTLHFVFPPSMGSARGEARLELVGASVRTELGVEVSVAVADSYDDLEHRARHHATQLVWAPPLIAARLLPLTQEAFQSVRHGVCGYHAALITRRDAPFGVDSLQGRVAAWVGRSSLAGYRLPRELLRSRGFDPDTLFAAQHFVGAYPRVLAWIARGDADVGGICVNLPTNAGLRETVAQYGGAALRDRIRSLAVSDRVSADCILVLDRMPRLHAEAICTALETPGRSRIGAAFTMALEADRFQRADEAARRDLQRLLHL